MQTYKYKGFEIQKNATGTTISARRVYSGATHRGFPQPFTPVATNAESAGQAHKALEDHIATH